MACTAVILLLAPPPGWASSLYSWSGAASALWSNPSNWTPNGVPADGDTLAFPSGASNLTNTNDLAASTSFVSMVFNGSGYTLNGNGIVLTSSLSATVGGATTVNLPINVATNAVTFNAYDLTLGGSLSGSGPITISPTGGNGVHIAASGSYSGTITANGHLQLGAVSLPIAAIASSNILRLDGTSLPATAVTHGGSSYALNGYGTIGALTATGPVFPADSYSCGNATARQLNTGNLNLNGMGCFALNGAGAGTGYSQLNVAGTVSLGAGSSLNLSLSPSFVPAQGQSFVLINNDGADPVSGIFNGLPEGSVVTLNSVYQFTVSYVGGSGNDVVLTCTVAPHAWTGATSALWSNPNNWNPATVPQAGDTLLFPSGAANLTNTNDLAPFTSFVNLVFGGNGYTLNGNGIVLTTAISATVGSTTINLPINVGINAVTLDAYDLTLGGSLSGTGPITISPTGGYGVHIAASGSYSGTITGNGPLRFDAVSLPATAIASNSILRLDGASLPATAVTHNGGPYALNGYGTIGTLTATGAVFPGGSYSCGSGSSAGQINTGNLSLGGQGCFALNGAAVGTGYSQLNVAGTVSLGAGSSLNVSLSPSFIPALGQPFVLINNDGADPVNGIFNGLPEGSVVTLNSVYQFVLSYVGGSGNDVVLTSLNGLPLPTVALVSSLNPSTPGQNVTFTATVAGSGPVPTGTVTFLDGFSTLASSPLNGSGVATYSTTLLGVGTHSISAQYNSDANYGGAVSSTLAQVVGQASQFLTFVPPPIVTVGGTGTVLATSANPNSGNPIQYSTLSPDCSVNSSSGVVAGLQVGSNNCTITASQAGNANYLAGTASQILSITKVTSSLGLASTCMLTFVESQPFTFSAAVTGLSPTGMVTFDDGNFQTLCSSVPLSAGTATCTSSALASPSATATTYLLGAGYSGDGNNTASTASVPLTVVVLSAADVVFRNGFDSATAQCPAE